MRSELRVLEAWRALRAGISDAWAQFKFWEAENDNDNESFLESFGYNVAIGPTRGTWAVRTRNGPATGGLRRDGIQFLRYVTDFRFRCYPDDRLHFQRRQHRQIRVPVRVRANRAIEPLPGW